ncbi:MAG: serine/threonine-protein kinase [Deltaproteobacteria bacterium]
MLGSYRLVERLGEGGMGEVFLAEHVRLGRRVALKILRPELSAQPDLVRRFFQEAKVVNRIAHPNIVEIYDFSEEPVAHFIMELLSGRDLARARAEEGPFPLARITAIARQVALGLARAHEKRVIHRDLKPENVFLCRRDGGDFVKILDFGLAKLAESGFGGEGAPPGSRGLPHTQLGMILGTPEFMSPEQAGGRAVDLRSDIYALGLLVYWMLADEVPLRGRSFGEMVALRETQPPPPLPEVTAAGEPLPAALAGLTLACLERDVARRPASLRLFLERLATFEAEAPLALPRPSPARTSLWLIAALAFAALVGGGVWWFDRRAPPPALVGAPPRDPPAVVAAPASPPAAGPAAVVSKGTPPVARPDAIVVKEAPPVAAAAKAPGRPARPRRRVKKGPEAKAKGTLGGSEIVDPFPH